MHLLGLQGPPLIQISATAHPKLYASVEWGVGGQKVYGRGYSKSGENGETKIDIAQYLIEMKAQRRVAMLTELFVDRRTK